MDVGAVREAMHASPFRPFRLRLADGRKLAVPHPDFIAVAPNGRRVVVFSVADESMSILEPVRIVSLEVGPPAAAAGGDGAGG